MKLPRLLWLGCGLVLLAVAAMALLGDLVAHVLAYLALHALAFVGMLLALAGTRRAAPGPALALAVIVGVAARLLLLPADPSLSGDLYRYLWDANAQHQGINPFRWAPAAPEVGELRDQYFERINHAEISTVYPPAAQAVFWLGALLSATPLGLKASLLLFDLGTLALVAWLERYVTRSGGMPGPPGPRAAVGWALSPLVIVEVAGSGHIDVAGVFFLLAASLLIIRARWTLSILALAVSALCKYFALSLLPVFWRRVGWPRVVLALGLFGVAWLPYLDAGAGLTRGLLSYAQRWQHNDLLYGALESGIAALGPAEPLTRALTGVRAAVGDEHSRLGFLYAWVHPRELARLITLAVFGVCALLLAWRRSDPLRAGFLLGTLFVLLSPTLHPWYLIWVLPFGLLQRSLGVLVLSGTLPLSYEVLARSASPDADWSQPLWIKLMMFVPFWLALGFDLWRAWLERRRSAAARTAAPTPGAPQPSASNGRLGWLKTRWGRWLVASVVGLALVLVALSIARDPGASGVVLGPRGEPAAGVVVDATWYVRKERAVWGGTRLRATYGVPDTLELSDQIRSQQRVITAADGSYRLQARWLWTGLGNRGPLLRLRLEAPDPYDGAPAPVRSFQLGDGRRVVGAYDEGAPELSGQRQQLLVRLAYPWPGQRNDLALWRGLAATAEGDAGARLFALERPPRQLAHLRPEQIGGAVRRVDFGDGYVHLFGDAGWRLVDPQQGVLRGGHEGPYLAWLGERDGEWLLLRADGLVERFEPGEQPQPLGAIDLLEERRHLPPSAERLLLYRGVLVYHAGDGSLRVWSRGDETPYVLRDGVQPWLAVAADEQRLVLQAQSGLQFVELERGERPRRGRRLPATESFRPSRLLVSEGTIWRLGQQGWVRTREGQADQPIRMWQGEPPDELELANAMPAPDGTIWVPRLGRPETAVETGEPQWDVTRSRFVRRRRSRSVAAELDAWTMLGPDGARLAEVASARIQLGQGDDPPPVLVGWADGSLWAAAARGGVVRLPVPAPAD